MRDDSTTPPRRALRTALVLAVIGLGGCATRARLRAVELAPLPDDDVLWLAQGRASPEEAEGSWLARGSRDGGLAWTRRLPDHAELPTVWGRSLGSVGDTAIVTLEGDVEHVGASVTGVHAYALVDGAPRWSDLEGYGQGDADLQPAGSFGDAAQRIELAAPRPPHAGGRVRAYDEGGVAWTFEVTGSMSNVVALPTTDRIVVVPEQAGDELRWHALDRDDGHALWMVAQNVPYGFHCVSPTALYLEQPRGIDRIDLATGEHRQFVALPLPLEPIPGGRTAHECGILGDGSLVVSLTGLRESVLAELDPDTGELERVIDLERFSPIFYPQRPPGVLAITGTGDAFSMIAVIDHRRGTLVGHPRELDPRRRVQGLADADRSWVIGNRTLGVLDPHGALAGTRRISKQWARDEARMHDGAVWLRPASAVRPGRLRPLVTRTSDLAKPRGTLARAMAPRRISRGPVPLSCLLRPAACVHGDGLGLSATPLPPVDSSASMPEWERGPLLRRARRFAGALPHARAWILAWSIVEDDRELRNHNVVVLVEHHRGHRARHSVVTMYRHAVDTEWNISNSIHSGLRPITRFRGRPDAAGVQGAMDDAGWQWARMLDFAVLAGRLPPDTWLEVLAELPTEAIEITPIDERPRMELAP